VLHYIVRYEIITYLEIKPTFLKDKQMNKPIKAIIQTKNGLRTILTGYHIKNNPNCLAMYSTSTGKLVYRK
jgi:hypothetical protein